MRIPTVSRADVERVVRRDFPPELYDTVLSLLDEYGKADWQRERDRVQLALLKLAAGNADKLLEWLPYAMQDYPDALIAAETPDFGKTGFVGRARLSAEQKQNLSDREWAQYSEWLYRK
jgi:hypothetical protein